MEVAGCSAGCTADCIVGCIAGCTAGVSAFVSCGSCTYLDSFLFRVLLRTRGGLSGSFVCSVDVCSGQCSLIDECWCNNGRVDKHVSGILVGISASSIGCAPTAPVRGGSSVDAGEGSSVGVVRHLVTSCGVSASEVAL